MVQGRWTSILNTSITYYQLLGITPVATQEELEIAYKNKILEISQKKIPNIEIYQTAYYTLSDNVRRKAYDDSIGILHRNKIPICKRLALMIGRLIFTTFDIIYELAWSLIIVLLMSLIGYGIYYYKKNDVFDIKTMLLSIDVIYLYIAASTIVLCAVLYLLHPKIRRINRKLKHSLRKYK